MKVVPTTLRRQAQGRFFLCLVTTPPSHLWGEDVAYQGCYRRGCCFAPLRLSTMPGILFHAENSRGHSGELASFQNVSLPKIMTSFARNASSCTICKSVRLRQLLQSSRRGRMRSWLPRLVPWTWMRNFRDLFTSPPVIHWPNLNVHTRFL